MKVEERVLERRLRQAVEIDKMQFGFRPGTGTIDAIFIARYRGKHRELWWVFVDLEKAFDRVSRKVVEWAMRNLGTGGGECCGKANSEVDLIKINGCCCMMLGFVSCHGLVVMSCDSHLRGHRF